MTERAIATEADILFAALPAVSVAIPRCRIFRRAIVEGQMAAGWYAKAGIPGQCDAYVLADRSTYKNWYVEIEAKSRVGKHRQQQLAWRALCLDLSIPYLEWRVSRGETPEQTVGRWVAELRRMLDGADTTVAG